MNVFEEQGPYVVFGVTTGLFCLALLIEIIFYGSLKTAKSGSNNNKKKKKDTMVDESCRDINVNNNNRSVNIDTDTQYVSVEREQQTWDDGVKDYFFFALENDFDALDMRPLHSSSALKQEED